MTMSSNLREQRDRLSYPAPGQGAIVPKIAIYRSLPNQLLDVNSR